MATHARPSDAPLVACDVCLKQIPTSEAMVPEATDYVVHFCGLECYRQWENQRQASDAPTDKPSS